MTFSVMPAGCDPGRRQRYVRILELAAETRAWRAWHLSARPYQRGLAGKMWSSGWLHFVVALNGATGRWTRASLVWRSSRTAKQLTERPLTVQARLWHCVTPLPPSQPFSSCSPGRTPGRHLSLWAARKRALGQRCMYCSSWQRFTVRASRCKQAALTQHQRTYTLSWRLLSLHPPRWVCIPLRAPCRIRWLEMRRPFWRQHLTGLMVLRRQSW
mmetsp:Transcript_42931/g.109837  ORF Transcript_42931/g.109837 Transcript_42931/m.109837 type:complete len:214 (+) Transcript_42931:221-862(+)